MAQVHARKDKIVDGTHEGRRVSSSRRTRSPGSRGPRGCTGNGGVDDVRGRRADAAGRRRSSSRPARRRGACRASRSTAQRIITSDEAIHLKDVPKSIVIMGSGAVGVEFASIFSRFGSEVTIIELLPRLVPVEDEAVSAELEKSFRKQGITAHRHQGDAAPRRAATASTSRRSCRTARRETAARPTTCSWPPAAAR